MATQFARLITLISFIVTFASPAHSQVVETDAGPVQGVEEDGVVVYKGIPFAAPPVGELRWREPQPAKPWVEVKPAAFSPICPQRGAYPKDSPPEVTSEDCLYLNIWKPMVSSEEKAAEKKLAVMLWIYGGALRNGSASTPLYAGDQLARNGVIVVTANYRLGVLGFLAHPELTKEAAHLSSGNYGLMDQLAALRWIQKNIAAFGGDPDRVTVFGQSSGSNSISALISSPLSKGMIHRAIGQSGGLFEPMEFAGDMQLNGAEAAGQSFGARANATSLQVLRDKSVDELLLIPFRPHIIVDGYVLPRTPYEMHRRNEHNKVPALIGYTTEEGQEFLANRIVTVANFEEELGRDFPSFIVRLTAPDPGINDQEARAAAIGFERDVRFGWSMWRWARFASREGDAGAWFYRFSRATPFPADSPQAGWKAAHGTEMPYVFGHLDLHNWNWTEHDRALSSAMIGYWTNFAKAGTPNGTSLPLWPQFTEAKPLIIQLGEQIAPALLPTKGTLSHLDRLYATARWIARNVYGVVAIAVLVVAGLVWGVIAIVRRRKRKHAWRS